MPCEITELVQLRPELEIRDSVDRLTSCWNRSAILELLAGTMDPSSRHWRAHRDQALPKVLDPLERPAQPVGGQDCRHSLRWFSGCWSPPQSVMTCSSRAM